jgi:hypothetical protein
MQKMRPKHQLFVRNRFEIDSPLHALLRTQPHVAYKVSDLAGRRPRRLAVIDNAGMPVELI